ncbi:MAG: hypothetical protein Q8Q84_08520 [Hydrogenophaga sp.]|nr:hypothetical protein [Hydrogenophaga sp.]
MPITRLVGLQLAEGKGFAKTCGVWWILRRVLDVEHLWTAVCSSVKRHDTKTHWPKNSRDNGMERLERLQAAPIFNGVGCYNCMHMSDTGKCCLVHNDPLLATTGQGVDAALQRFLPVGVKLCRLTASRSEAMNQRHITPRLLVRFELGVDAGNGDRERFTQSKVMREDAKIPDGYAPNN